MEKFEKHPSREDDFAGNPETPDELEEAKRVTGVTSTTHNEKAQELYRNAAKIKESSSKKLGYDYQKAAEAREKAGDTEKAQELYRKAAEIKESEGDKSEDDYREAAEFCEKEIHKPIDKEKMRKKSEKFLRK